MLTNLPMHKKLILRYIGWFFLINSILFWLIGYCYLKNILLSPSLFANDLADYSTLAGKLMVVSFAVVNYFSYMMFLAFIPAFPLLLFAYCVPNQSVIWFFSVLIATSGVVLLIADTNIYAMFKFHISLMYLKMLFQRQWYDIFDFSIREIEFIIFISIGVAVLEIAISWWVWKKIIKPARYQFGMTIVIFWLGCFLLSYFTLVQSVAANNNLFSQQTPNLPFYNQIMAYLIPDKNAEDVLYRYSETHFSQSFFSKDKLQYPLHLMQCTKPEKTLNIILIMVDSLRFDSACLKYMPNLFRFAKQNWRFDQHMSAGNSTQAGLFSLFYSIPSSYWTAALEQKVSPVFMELLIKFGYTAHILWSSEMFFPPFDKTIYLAIHSLNVNGAPSHDIGDRDRHVTQQAIKFLANKQNKPFFLNLFYDAPHGYCREQSFSAPFQPASEACSRVAMSNEVASLPYYNRYLNSVYFVDSEIEKVLSVVKQKGYLDNSIVIITADHGQEFNDNKKNYWGHASNFTKYQVQVPLIIHWPNQTPRAFNHTTSGYDIVPTLLKRVFQCRNQEIDYSIGKDLFTKDNRLPFILAGSYINMGLIEKKQLTTLRTSGGMAVTNLEAEPNSNSQLNMNNVKKALELMRLYYVKK